MDKNNIYCNDDYNSIHLVYDSSIIIVMKVSDSRAITKAVFIAINIILIILTTVQYCEVILN